MAKGVTPGGPGVTALNVLRGTAALIVFLSHVRNSSFVEFGALPPQYRTPLTVVFFGITRTAHEAVMVFFVLSGFLVGGQVIRHVRDARFSLRSYALERATRIWLPLIPACLLTVVVDKFALGQSPSWWQVIVNMSGLNGVVATTLSGNSPLWTLAYEIWFYLFAGAVGYLLTARSSKAIAFTVIGCVACVFSILEARYLLFWCIGALSVLMLATPRRGILAATGAIIFIVGVAGFEMAAGTQSFANYPFISKEIAEAMICVGLAVSIPFLCQPNTNKAIRFISKPALFLSSISYTLYLVHYPLNTALDKFFPRTSDLSWHAIALFCTRLVIVLIGVGLFYLAFEANTGAVRRYFKSQK